MLFFLPVNLVQFIALSNFLNLHKVLFSFAVTEKCVELHLIETYDHEVSSKSFFCNILLSY